MRGSAVVRNPYAASMTEMARALVHLHAETVRTGVQPERMVLPRDEWLALAAEAAVISSGGGEVDARIPSSITLQGPDGPCVIEMGELEEEAQHDTYFDERVMGHVCTSCGAIAEPGSRCQGKPETT